MIELLEGLPESFSWLTFILFVIPSFLKGGKDATDLCRVWLSQLLAIQFSVSSQNSRFFLYRAALAKLVPKARRVKEVDIPGRGPAWMREEEEVETDVQPDLGAYWFKFEGTRCRVDYHQIEVKSNEGIKALASNEVLSFEFFTKDRKVLSRFRQYVHELEQEERKQRTTIWTNRWGAWVPISKRYPREEDTLFYEGGLHLEVLEDLSRFLDSPLEYRERGRVHKRGYIFYGPPGNGKTTLILWLAAQIGVDVAILSSCTDDETFLGLVTRVPKGAVLLLEDVDALFASSKSREQEVKTKGKKKGKKKAKIKINPDEGQAVQTVSLSVLLNYLDGMLSREGQIVFMTTNYFDRIDAALLRRGRADRRLLLGSPSGETARMMFEAAYPKTQSATFLWAFDKLDDKPSFAELEGLFDRFEPGEIIDQLGEPNG